MSDEATTPAPQSSGLAGFVLQNRSLMHPLSIIMILYAVWAVVEVFSNTYFHGLQSLTIFETGVETNINPDDLQRNNSSWVIASGAVFGLFAGWYYWFEKMFGIKYNGMIGGLHFWLMFIGSNVLFFPQHFLGLQGMPRRYIDYADGFATWHMWSSIGYAITLVATLIFFVGLVGRHEHLDDVRLPPLQLRRAPLQLRAAPPRRRLLRRSALRALRRRRRLALHPLQLLAHPRRLGRRRLGARLGVGPRRRLGRPRRLGLGLRPLRLAQLLLHVEHALQCRGVVVAARQYRLQARVFRLEIDNALRLGLSCRLRRSFRAHGA